MKFDRNAKLPEARSWQEIASAQQQMQSSLHVPDSGPCDSNSSFVDRAGRYFRCADGTVIDTKSRKIVQAASAQKDLDFRNDSTWNDREINSLPSSMANPSLSKKDVEYWKAAEDGTKSMLSGMSDAQKKMLADLEAGKFFPTRK